MALTDENGGNFNVSMPVQPMGGGYGGYSYPMAYPVMPYSGGFGGGFGDNFGGDWIDYSIETEFGKLIDGKIAADAWDVMQELVDALKITNPKLYNFVLRKLEQI